MTDEIDIETAVRALENGDVVAVPTDTVYGLAASLKSDRAIEKLFTLKHRPGFVPLPLLVSSIDQITALGVELNDAAKKLAKAFWPGPLTIVVAAPEPLAKTIRSPSPSAGFRIPENDILCRLLERTGPLAVTSANDHGEDPCHSVSEVHEVFADRDDLAGVLDGGLCRGAVSTVIDVSLPQWRVIRERAISSEVLATYLD